MRRVSPVLILLLAACASAATQLPTLAEARPELVAYALFGSFVIVEEAAADIAEKSTTPPNVRQALITADAAAAPIVRQLRPLAERVELLRNSSDTAALLGAIRELEIQIAQASPLIQRLSALVMEAR